MKFKENNEKIKEEKLNKIKNNIKGITLIALVVTIIVLIILAGVSINLVLGDNGIITKVKEAKTRTEQAQLNEQVMLNETAEYLENMGVVETPQKIKTIAELKEEGTYTTSKTTVKDSNGNLIEIPEGFKIASDSGINVTEGIVIEDNDIIQGIGNDRGNQYVWIPVGEKIKKQEEDGSISEVDITLGRYVFADGTNHKDEEENVLTIGTPILKQSADDYADEIEIYITDTTPTSTSDYGYKELKDNRPGVASGGLDGENATALNLKGFIDSVKANGGYYIARYEASYGVDEKANSKVSDNFNNSTTAPTTEGYLWNNITQINAATACRDLYETAKTDLINSYAWDTAIVYIQEFSTDTDYSYQDGKSINSSLANTGVNGDEICKINDMASNTVECTTEYSTGAAGSYTFPCTGRGGNHGNANHHASDRFYSPATTSGESGTFRSALYL